MGGGASPAARLERLWWRRPTAWGAWLLAPLAAAFGLAEGVNRWAYRVGWRRAKVLHVPVIVVGNLIVGGAGKTPTTMAVVAQLQAWGWRPGVVSRGHGRSGDGVLDVQREARPQATGDEPLLIHRRTGVPVYVGRDRVAAAMALLRAHPTVDVLVADDGLQHHRLARDVEVVVFDARGAGNGLLLPAGPLRQPLRSLAPLAGRPAAVLLYNAGAPSTPWPGHVARRGLSGACTLNAWAAGHPAAAEALQALRGRPVTALAGIAEPGRFFAMLAEAGLQVTPCPRPDHDPLDTLPPLPPGHVLVVTEKDAVKLAGRTPDTLPVWVVPLDFRPPAAFFEALKQRLADAHHKASAPWTTA